MTQAVLYGLDRSGAVLHQKVLTETDASRGGTLAGCARVTVRG